MRRFLIGVVGGLAISAAVVLALRELTPDFYRSAGIRDQAATRSVALWSLVLGVGIGAVVLASRRSALISGVPAAALFLLYLPLMVGSAPDWYPEVIQSAVLISYGQTLAVIVSVVSGRRRLWARALSDEWLECEFQDPGLASPSVATAAFQLEVEAQLPGRHGPSRSPIGANGTRPERP